MTTNHDALPDPQDHHPQCNVNAFTRYDRKCDCFVGESEPEQQAQAGAPEVVMWQWRRKSDQWTLDKSFYFEVKATTDDSEVRQLITLQSHREAIAQHRAALEAERNRLDFLAQTQSHIEWSLAGDCCRLVPLNGFSHWFDTPRDAIDAAIKQAEEARK